MKKISIFLVVYFVFSLFIPSQGYAVTGLQPTEDVYAQYVFSSSLSDDYAKNMSFTSLCEHSDYGLEIRPFTESVDSVTGNNNKSKSTQTSYIDFNVTTAPQGYNDYYVEVEYLNYPIGFFYLSYTDKSGKLKKSELVCCSDVGDKTKPVSERVAEAKKVTAANSETKKHIFRLENVDFTKSKDFTIETIRSAKNSNFEFSPQYVYIKSVSVYKDAKLPIKAEIKSDKTGNIFYDGDLPEFDIKFTDNIDSNVNFDVAFNVYKYDNNGDAALIDEFSKTVMTNAFVNQDESITESFSINISDFGLYLLEVNITANGRTYTAASAEFSKCVGNDQKNAALGVNVHSRTWDNGTLKNYMELMKNGGFGLVREGVVWGTYEKSDGSFSLENSDFGFFKICDEYGIEPYVILNIQNPRACIDKSNSGLVDSSALDGVYKFVEKLLDEPSFQNINHFEICNEPNIKVFYDEDEKVLKYGGQGKDELTKVYTAKGKAYGKICEKAIDAIRSKRGSSAQIGILSLCNIDSRFDTSGSRYIWSERYCSDNFIKGTLDYLTDPNGDGDKSDSKLGEADTITYHPYAYFVNPEVINERSLTGVTDITKEYGFNPQSSWHTEFGWSTAKFPTNSACIGDDYAQAKNIVRQYASMYTHNNNDKFFIYDFIDDDIVTNAQESNYGLLHSEIYNTPYAAKLSYLAVSNLNKMVGDLPNAEFVYNTVDALYTGDYTTETNGYGTKGEMVARFSGDGDKKVYMLWGIEDNKEITYKIPEKVISYYDYLGNKIDPTTVETTNGYRVSTEPFYAVCGIDNNTSVITGEDNSVKITIEGNTNENNANDTVIALISDQDAKSAKNINKANLIYADFCTSSASGYYRFDCGTVTTKNKVYAYIIEADGTETKTEVKARRNNAEIYLIKNMQRLDQNSVSISNLDGVSVMANLRDDIKSNPDTQLIFTFLKDGKLTYVEPRPIAESYTDENINIPVGAEYDEIQVFLWNGLTSIKPLCDNIYIR